MDSILRDFKRWTGGFPPEDSHQVETYIATAMPKGFDEDEVREFLMSKIED